MTRFILEDFRPRHRWLPLLMGLALGLAHIVYADWRARQGHSDFLCFHRTSLHWFNTGQFTQEYGVRHYLPAFVVLVAPLVAWPLWLAAALWAGLNCLLLALCARETGRGVAWSLNTRLPAVLFWLWPVLLIFPFASGTIALGQVNILVLWLCLWAWSRLRECRDIRAGLALAAAGVIKLYPLLLIVPLILRARYRAAGATAILFAALAIGLSVAGFGWEGAIQAHREWLAEVRGGDAADGHLIFRDGPSEFYRHNNQSLAVVVRRLTTTVDTGHGRVDSPLGLSPAAARALYAALAGTVLLILAGATWRRRGQGPLFFGEWVAWLASVIVLVPIYWTHYFVLLLPALALLGAWVWAAQRQGQSAWRAALLQAAWLAGLLLLAYEPARWIGLHCWLAIMVALWSVLRAERTSASMLTD